MQIVPHKRLTNPVPQLSMSQKYERHLAKVQMHLYEKETCLASCFFD